MSDQLIISLVGTGVGLVGTIITAVLAFKVAQIKAQGQAVARVADATHTLVNANMGTQLRKTAALANRLAELTGDPQDMLKAREAERQVREHEMNQAKVDAANPGGLPKAAAGKMATKNTKVDGNFSTMDYPDGADGGV